MSVLMRRENTLIIEPGSDISKIQIINFILLPNSKKHFEGPPLQHLVTGSHSFEILSTMQPKVINQSIICDCDHVVTAQFENTMEDINIQMQYLCNLPGNNISVQFIQELLQNNNLQITCANISQVLDNYQQYKTLSIYEIQQQLIQKASLLRMSKYQSYENFIEYMMSMITGNQFYYAVYSLLAGTAIYPGNIIVQLCRQQYLENYEDCYEIADNQFIECFKVIQDKFFKRILRQ
ncbi:Hypothetical_protein [Hexamita inflata]|uniref:Hypothetical_protein n=1 Tax=Hexamita inflata TaxID=28002 RepID=A0AA86NU57_9EUKA|nr:Hypothetical protein HINF_LOCUS13855 [Hexamita inflata]